MNLTCPHCQSKIAAKPQKPGKYTTKCPKCSKPIQLVVSDDPNQPVQVRAVQASSSAPASAPKPAVMRAPAKPNTNTEATGEFTDPSSGRSSGADPEATEATGVYVARPQPPVEDTAEITGAFSPGPSVDHEATEATGAFQPRPNTADVDRTAAGTGGDIGDDPEDYSSPGAGVKKSTKKKASAGETDVPDQLGGYEVVKQLGAGGMGAVYLARQVSLDRDVALKVMHANWARDPIFLARFTREAYAAAQLNHHNVVQIYDIGADAGINFFSMEFVNGKSLGDLLKKTGPLDAPTAVGYVLQAARGLKFAHDRGMVHRDIKPDNIMVNVEGLVKVADLGLVKTRDMTAADDQPGASSSSSPSLSQSGGGSKLRSVSTEVTNVGSAMGTPSYMAPEQCRDASAVDHRADVYSLGCSLYALLSGKAPFQGNTAMELLHKHQHEPPKPLATVVKGLSRELAAIVDQCLAKDPADRFQTMDELIAALKAWQDLQNAGPPKPSEDQIAAFEGLSAKLPTSPLGALGGQLALLLPAVGFGLGLILLFVATSIGVALLLATLSGVVAGFVTAGMLTDSYLFRKTREWAFGARIVDWATAIGVILLALGAMYLAGWFVTGFVGIVLGTLIGIGFGYGLVRPAHGKRQELRGGLDGVLRRLRLAGMDEDAVREFAAQASGDKSEAVYDLLFGHAAKLALRADLAAKGQLRPMYNAQTDALVRRLDSAIEARKQAAARRHLQALEQKRLVAEGVSVADAKAQAADAADDLVEQAATLKAASADKTQKVNVRAVLTRYEKAKLQEIRRPRKPLPLILLNKLVRTVFDPRLRLLAGALLIVGGVLWARQNADALSGIDAAIREKNIDTDTKQQALSVWNAFKASSDKTKPLSAAWLPSSVAGLFDSVNPIVAGVLLILSAFASSPIAIVVVTLAALVTLAGHKLGLPVPAVGPLTPAHVTMVGGLLLSAAALAVFRRRGYEK